ncbi:MAG: monovalent cation/H(+) antiporter subunit G [Desulfobacteraceae bacterium]|nr:MAG: monovalent cation/H(+) antiporter subunit G [Desulfobacteraceae bacterium]
MISSFFLVTGALFILVAALGILRFEDIYMRTSASAKAATLGVGLSLAGMAFHFAVLEITVRSVAIIIFIMITTPIAAHLISRAAYISGAKLWDKSVVDELQGKYDPETGDLSSPE